MVVSLAIGVIFLLLVFVFLTTYYFVGTQREERATKTLCHCQHLSNQTETKVSGESQVGANDLRYSVSFFNKLQNKDGDSFFTIFLVLTNPP